MTEDIRMMDPFTQPWAIDGVPADRPLTEDDLRKIKDALKEFESAVIAWGERGRAAAEQARQHDEDSGIAGPNSADEFHCLILTGYLGERYGPDRSTEEAVAEVCARHFDPAPDGDSVERHPGTIHVVLDSDGGLLDSAYRVVLFLRSFVTEVRVYVPRHAKSAATLIAVGSDRIVMSPYAELGPLDTQIPDPRNPTTHISALDCYQSVDYVRRFGIETVSRALKAMLDETRKVLPLTQLLDSATTFAIGSVEPMLEQMKGLDFGAWGRMLNIGETYTKVLRHRLRYPDSEEAAQQLAWKLVYGYPHHRYPIDRVEAKHLGLAVYPMPNDVYKAAKVIAEACKGGSRFVGFSNDVEDAISERFAEPKDSWTPTDTAGANTDRADGTLPTAQAYPVSPDVPGPWSKE